jgi:hypothetical protein
VVLTAEEKHMSDRSPYPGDAAGDDATPMPMTEAQITTTRPSRYLVQICTHAASMGRGHHGARMHFGDALARREVQVDADWSKTRGVITFTPWGQCTMTADDAALKVRVEATDEENMIKIRDIITRDLDRMGRRDGLTINWHPAS